MAASGADGADVLGLLTIAESIHQFPYSRYRNDPRAWPVDSSLRGRLQTPSARQSCNGSKLHSIHSAATPSQTLPVGQGLVPAAQQLVESTSSPALLRGSIVPVSDPGMWIRHRRTQRLRPLFLESSSRKLDHELRGLPAQRLTASDLKLAANASCESSSSPSCLPPPQTYSPPPRVREKVKRKPTYASPRPPRTGPTHPAHQIILPRPRTGASTFTWTYSSSYRSESAKALKPASRAEAVTSSATSHANGPDETGCGGAEADIVTGAEAQAGGGVDEGDPEQIAVDSPGTDSEPQAVKQPRSTRAQTARARF